MLSSLLLWEVLCNGMQVDLLVNNEVDPALHPRSGVPANAVVDALSALPVCEDLAHTRNGYPKVGP